MRAAIISICSTLALVVACSGGAGTATSLRGGPDGIPKSSTDAPGNGYEPPGNSNQDPSGNSNQESPGGDTTTTACLSCSGVYSCVVPGSTDGNSIFGLVPASGGCGVIDTQNGPVTGTLLCGGGISIASPTSDDQGLTESWTGGSGTITITASAKGQTIVLSCTLSNQSLPTSTSTTVSGGTDTTDAG